MNRAQMGGEQGRTRNVMLAGGRDTASVEQLPPQNSVESIEQWKQFDALVPESKGSNGAAPHHAQAAQSDSRQANSAETDPKRDRARQDFGSTESASRGTRPDTYSFAQIDSAGLSKHVVSSKAVQKPSQILEASQLQGSKLPLKQLFQNLNSK